MFIHTNITDLTLNLTKLRSIVLGNAITFSCCTLLTSFSILWVEGQNFLDIGLFLNESV